MGVYSTPRSRCKCSHMYNSPPAELINSRNAKYWTLQVLYHQNLNGHLAISGIPKRSCLILKRHHWPSSFSGSSGGHFLVRCACAGTRTGVWSEFYVADVSERSSPKSFICSYPKKMLTRLEYTTLIWYSLYEVLTARGSRCFFFSRNIN